MDNENERYWFTCPVCGQKICQFTEDAMSMKLYIKCKKCHNEIELKINMNNQEDERQESNIA